MSDITISYKGSSIATMDATGTKTLLTEGKYCEDDITVDYVKPSGGGLTPPVNAVAQFPLEITFSAQPTSTFTFDLTDIIDLLTNSRTYVYEMALWRDDVVSETTFTRIGQMIHSWGRIDKNNGNGGGNCSELRVYSTNAGAMTSSTQLTSDDMRNSNSISAKKMVVALKNLTAADITGKWKGIYTLLPPWKDEYTGTQLITCPTGFLSYT